VLVLCGPGGTLGTEPGRVMRQGQRRRLTAAPSGAMAIAGCVAGSSMTPRCFYVTRSPRRRGDRPGPTVVDDQVAAYRALDDLGRIHPVAQRVHGAVAVCGGGWRMTEQQSERPARHAHLPNHAIFHLGDLEFAHSPSPSRRAGPGLSSRPPPRRLRVLDLEADGELQDAMLSVYHAIHHIFLGTGAAKIIENHHGRAAIVMMQQMLVTRQQAPNPGLPRPGKPALPASATPLPLNREQRRKQAR
jgi:hypothetical protein